VNLPVRHDADGTIPVVDRLVAGLQLEHPQPLHPQTHPSVVMDPRESRSRCSSPTHLRPYRLAIHRAPARAQLSDDAAHTLLPEPAPQRPDRLSTDLAVRAMIQTSRQGDQFAT
jgi:hypothetical protein